MLRLVLRRKPGRGGRLEVNLNFDRARLAASNAELVARVSEACAHLGRHAARPAEARPLLSLAAA